jgi:hypothetical protein
MKSLMNEQNTNTMRLFSVFICLMILASCQQDFIEGSLPEIDKDVPIYEANINLIDSLIFASDVSELTIRDRDLIRQNDSVFVYALTDGKFYCIDLFALELRSSGVYKQAYTSSFQDAHLLNRRYILTEDSREPLHMKQFDVNNGQLLLDQQIEAEPNSFFIDGYFQGEYWYVAEGKRFSNAPPTGQYVISKIHLLDPNLAKEEIYRSDTVSITQSFNLEQQLFILDELAFLSFSAMINFSEEKYSIDKVDLNNKARTTLFDTLLFQFDLINLNYAVNEDHYCYAINKELVCYHQNGTRSFHKQYNDYIKAVQIKQNQVVANIGYDHLDYLDLHTGIRENRISRTTTPLISDQDPMYGSSFFNYDTRTLQFCCFDLYSSQSLSCMDLNNLDLKWRSYHPPTNQFLLFSHSKVYRVEFPLE